MSVERAGETAPLSVPLVRMLARRPSSVEIWPGDPGRLRFYVHHIMREPVETPVSNVVGFVSSLGHASSHTGVALVADPIVPFLRNGRIGRPNLAFVFREPSALRRLRWGAAWYTGLPKEMPEIDGVTLCVKKGFAAAHSLDATLEAAGLTRYDSVFDALLACRASTDDADEIAELAAGRAQRVRTLKRNLRVYWVAFAVLFAARLGLGEKGGWNPALLAVYSVAIVTIVGVTFANRRILRNRRR